MGWVRLDDGIAHHPKLVEAGPLALALQVTALGYTNSHLTNGFVPASAPLLLVGFERYHVIIDAFSELWDWAAVMVEHGLWEPAPDRDGRIIHDYLDYQPSRAEALKRRDDLRAAHVQGGKARAACFARPRCLSAARMGPGGPTGVPGCR
jgi:hypothetical protein